MRFHRILRPLAVIAVLGVTASCISLYSGRSGIQADPLFLEDRGEVVFRQYQIPVVEQFANYRVSSGPFMVDEVWDRGLIEERVHCGLDPNGGPLADGARVRMTVTLKISHRNTGSRIALASSGRTLPTEKTQDTARCRLSAPFVEEILAAVAGEIPGGVRGWPTVRPPGVGVPGGRIPSAETF